MSGFVLQLARRFPPRNLAIVLAFVIASFAVLDLVYRHALDSLIAFQLEDSDPAVRNSLSAVITGVLLIGGGLLLVAAERLRPANGAAWWRPAGLVLVFLGVEQALGIHTWLEQHADVSWNIVYLPLLAVAAVVWFEAARSLSANRSARTLFALGAAAWLLSGLFDAARTGRDSALPAGELLEMGAASLLLLGAYVHARALSLAARPSGDRRELDLAIAESAVARLNLRSLAIGVGCLGLFFGVLGAIEYSGGDLRAFDLNKEQTFPATFSGIILLGAGALALLNGVVRCPDVRDRRWWLVLAVVFAFLGIDEVAALHEAVQDRVHVWGQSALIPIVIAGVAAWWIVLQRLRPQRDAARLFVLGAAAWVASQGVDLLFNEHFGWTIVPEELIEMFGSALFAFALLVAVKELVSARATAIRRPAPVAASRLEGLQAAR
jgi:hypothetical protein